MSIAEDTDLVVGVDTHRDTHSAAICDARGRVLSQRRVPATPAGYADLLARASTAGAGQRLAWAIEGTRHYGLGLARHLCGAGQQVAETGGTRHIGKRRAGKSDPIDAVRAARELLARPQPGELRADGDREALRLLMTGRDSAVQSAKTARTLIRLGERVCALGEVAADLEAQIAAIAAEMAPGLAAAEPGMGALSAAQILLSWSHAGRIHSEQAFAMLSGTAPVPVSSGRTDRYRLNRLGDRQLNRALHVIAVNRMRHHPPARAYVERRRAEGKTDKEIRRCIKRYLARHFYRVLTEMAGPATWQT